MEDFVAWFRQSAPYIRSMRGKTVVLVFGGEVFASEGFDDLVADVALLHTLGVRIVLVAGSRPQIDARLAERGVEARFHRGLRVTDAAALVAVKEAAGANRVELEQRFTMGLAGSAMAHARVRVAAGNFVVARPHGVIDGVDFQFTGRVRRIDVDAIRARLDEGAVVVLTPVGYSVTGETFNLSSPELAADTAIALKADKLVALVEGVDGDIHGELDSASAAERVAEVEGDLRMHLQQAIRAARGGVARAHLLGREADGSILRELYTRDGAGLMVTDELYEGVRRATIADVPTLMQILGPLEEAGKLVHRPREVLENDIDQFFVVERDGLVMGCAALYRHGEVGELACLAVDESHQERGRGEVLLRAVERAAREQKLKFLFVLTTQSVHWFQERGFAPCEPSELPRKTRPERNSKTLRKAL